MEKGQKRKIKACKDKLQCSSALQWN